MISQKIISRLATRNVTKHLATANFSAGTSSYEGDGKTKVSILNKEVDAGLMINAFSQMGFRLNNVSSRVITADINASDFIRNMFAVNVGNDGDRADGNISKVSLL